MNYEIIATLGPRSDTQRAWENMLAVGVTGFRLNTSHLSLTQLREWIERLGGLLVGRDPRPPLVLDLQGSKWRLGQFASRHLANGERVELMCAVSAERPDVLPVPHPDFFQAAAVSSGEIVLNDAKLRLAVVSQRADVICTRVIQGGRIEPRKGVTYTSSAYRQESLSEMDRVVLDETQDLAGIRYAVSYVKDGTEMAHYRMQIGSSAHLIAKLERQSAIDEAAQIAMTADELWLCRGDLGAELGARAMAAAAFQFSEQVRTLRVPALLAGQVFEHVTEHPAPTRSELCAAYDALMKGYRGLVLSDETAIGRDPVESCRIAASFRVGA